MPTAAQHTERLRRYMQRTHDGALASLKAYRVPDGGWTHETFRGRAARAYVAAQQRVRREALITATKALVPALKDVFAAQRSRVIRNFTERLAAERISLQAKAKMQISKVKHSALWKDALAHVFGDEIEVREEVSRPVRTAAERAMQTSAHRTTELLGVTASVGVTGALKVRAQDIGNKVTRINKTTRKRLASKIADSIKKGMSPFETIERLRTEMPAIESRRIPTIVRTEMGRAVDSATILAMKDSGVVTHVSVTGCEAIEPGIPTFRGVPTCNIKNVPILHAGSLQFHINHTGTVVASGFKTQAGTDPDIPLRDGTAAGTWEERGRPVPAIVNEPPPGDGPQKPPPTPELPAPTPPPTAPAPVQRRVPRDTARDVALPESREELERDYEPADVLGEKTRAYVHRQTGDTVVLRTDVGAGARVAVRDQVRALDFYNEGSVASTKKQLLRDSTSDVALSVTNYVEGQTLRDYLDNASAMQQDRLSKRMQREFVLDVAAGNTRAIEMADHIRVTKDGVPVRLRAEASVQSSISEFWTARKDPRRYLAEEDKVPVPGQNVALVSDLSLFDVPEYVKAPSFKRALALASDQPDAFSGAVKARARELLTIAYRAAEAQAFGIQEAFVDEVSYYAHDMKMSGVFSTLPRKLVFPDWGVPSGVVKENDASSVSYSPAQHRRRLLDYLTTKLNTTEDRATATWHGWADSHGGSSWAPGAARYKHWVAQHKVERSVSDKALWLRGTESYANQALPEQQTGHRGVTHGIYMAQQAYTLHMLEDVEMPNTDPARRSVRLMRTEQYDVAVSVMQLKKGGDAKVVARGINESFSGMSIVGVHGKELTENVMPFLAVNTHYLIPTLDRGAFEVVFNTGFQESEFAAMSLTPTRYLGTISEAKFLSQVNTREFLHKPAREWTDSLGDFVDYGALDETARAIE